MYFILFLYRHSSHKVNKYFTAYRVVQGCNHASGRHIVKYLTEIEKLNVNDMLQNVVSHLFDYLQKYKENV